MSSGNQSEPQTGAPREISGDPGPLIYVLAEKHCHCGITRGPGVPRINSGIRNRRPVAPSPARVLGLTNTAPLRVNRFARAKWRRGAVGRMFRPGAQRTRKRCEPPMHNRGRYFAIVQHAAAVWLPYHYLGSPFFSSCGIHGACPLVGAMLIRPAHLGANA